MLRVCLCVCVVHVYRGMSGSEDPPPAAIRRLSTYCTTVVTHHIHRGTALYGSVLACRLKRPGRVPLAVLIVTNHTRVYV